MIKVCIDAGHGGNDVGAVSISNKYEKDYNLTIAKTVKGILSRYECEVIMTRDADLTLSLQDRCNIANKNNCNVFVSIHNNSASNKNAQGHEIWVYSNNSLSKDISNCLSNLNSKDRGIKVNKNFTVLANTKMTACLVECAFISNFDNEKFLQDNIYEISLNISIGIVINLNLKLKSEIECPTCSKCPLCGK